MDVDLDGDGNATEASDPRYAYTYDAVGNVLGLHNEAGHLVEGYVYSPYGQPLVLVPNGTSSVKWDGNDTERNGTYGSSPEVLPYSPAGNVWFFTGRQYDPEIGLYNYRARHYHPDLGQFMSLDPIGAWNDPLSLGNPYTYVGNNPSTYRDPTGLCPLCLTAGIGAVAGAVAGAAIYTVGVATTDAGFSWGHLGGAVGLGAAGGALIGTGYGIGAGTGLLASIGGAAVSGVGEGLLAGAVVDSIDDGQINADTQSYVAAGVTGGIGGAAGQSLAIGMRQIAPALARSRAAFALDEGGEGALLPKPGSGAGEKVLQAGGREFQLTNHAFNQMADRSISRAAMTGALEQRPFQYFHANTWKTGYFDPTTNTFVATVENRITTTMQGSGVPRYLENNGWWKP